MNIFRTQNYIYRIPENHVPIRYCVGYVSEASGILVKKVK